MNKLLYLFLLLVACGDYQALVIPDKEFSPYLLEFSEDYGMDVTHYPIYFRQLDKNIAGVCLSGQGRNKIYIDPDWWSTYSSAIKRVVIYHELGHCLLQRSHDDTLIVDSMGLVVPKSFMFPYVDARLAIPRNLEYYKNELIGE